MDYAEYKYSVRFAAASIVIAALAVAASIGSILNLAVLSFSIAFLSAIFLARKKRAGIKGVYEISIEKVAHWQRLIKAVGAVYFSMFLIVIALFWKTGVTSTSKISCVAMIVGLYVLTSAATNSVRAVHTEGSD